MRPNPYDPFKMPSPLKVALVAMLGLVAQAAFIIGVVWAIVAIVMWSDLL